MKSQARLRLRGIGRYHAKSNLEWRGRWRLLANSTGVNLGGVLVLAFEMNCHPKHYDTGIEGPCYTMDYITGKTTWHGPPHAFAWDTAVITSRPLSREVIDPKGK